MGKFLVVTIFRNEEAEILKVTAIDKHKAVVKVHHHNLKKGNQIGDFQNGSFITNHDWQFYIEEEKNIKTI